MTFGRGSYWVANAAVIWFVSILAGTLGASPPLVPVPVDGDIALLELLRERQQGNLTGFPHGKATIELSVTYSYIGVDGQSIAKQEVRSMAVDVEWLGDQYRAVGDWWMNSTVPEESTGRTRMALCRNDRMAFTLSYERPSAELYPLSQSDGSVASIGTPRSWVMHPIDWIALIGKPNQTTGPVPDLKRRSVELEGERIRLRQHYEFDTGPGEVVVDASTEMEGQIVHYHSMHNGKLRKEVDYGWTTDAKGRAMLTRKSCRLWDVEDVDEPTGIVEMTVRSFDLSYRPSPQRFTLRGLDPPRGTVVCDQVLNKRYMIGSPAASSTSSFSDKLEQVIGQVRDRGFGVMEVD